MMILTGMSGAKDFSNKKMEGFPELFSLLRLENGKLLLRFIIVFNVMVDVPSGLIVVI